VANLNRRATDHSFKQVAADRNIPTSATSISRSHEQVVMSLRPGLRKHI